jgi:hypothetical protein
MFLKSIDALSSRGRPPILRCFSSRLPEFRRFRSRAVREPLPWLHIAIKKLRRPRTNSGSFCCR